MAKPSIAKRNDFWVEFHFYNFKLISLTAPHSYLTGPIQNYNESIFRLAIYIVNSRLPKKEERHKLFKALFNEYEFPCHAGLVACFCSCSQNK
jgi:hypothetical protein